MDVDCILGSIQSFLAAIGLHRYGQAVSLWLFFAACGVAQLLISFLVCTPLERFRPLTSWPKRNPIAADVTYALFVRLVVFPLIAYFEYDWLHRNLDGFLRTYSITPPSLSKLILSSHHGQRPFSSPTSSSSIWLTIGGIGCRTGMGGGMEFTPCTMPKTR